MRTDVRRPTLMGVAVRGLDRLAVFLGHRQTGNRHWLAPQGLPAVLDVESSSRPTRAPTGVERDPPTDSEDEPRPFSRPARFTFRREGRASVERTGGQPGKLANRPGL
jgi:hypothetical protein